MAQKTRQNKIFAEDYTVVYDPVNANQAFDYDTILVMVDYVHTPKITMTGLNQNLYHYLM